MVGPAYCELLYLQAEQLNSAVVKAVITFLPFVSSVFMPQFGLRTSPDL